MITDGVAGSSVILWHRVMQFKQVSLKMVVSRVLQQQNQVHTRLVIPGELKLNNVQIPAPLNRQQFHLCMSGHQAESAMLRSQIMKVVMAAPSRTQSRSERVLQSIGRTDDKSAGGVPPQQLRVGILGEGGCTMQSSSNFLLLLSTRNLLNKELMDDVRSALILGLNVITIHNKDPSGKTEEFDSFIGACPADLRDGRITRNGDAIECPRLFDSLAVDWMGGDTTEYKEVSVALAIRAVKPAGKVALSAEQAAKRTTGWRHSSAIYLSGALAKEGGPDATKQVVSVIEIGDI
jgi:hypothetical protein